MLPNLSPETLSRRERGDAAARVPMLEIPQVLVDLNLPRVREFASQLRFSPTEGSIWLADRRMVLLHAEAFTALREELIASLGMDTARGLLTRIGYAAGCRDAQLVWKLIGDGATLREMMRTGAVLHSLQGFVLPESVHAPDGTGSPADYYAEWIWRNSIEDEGHVAQHGVGTSAVCWTEVGYSSGYLSTTMGRRILVRELECRALGHAHCRNVARPVSSWEDAEDDLRFLEPQPQPPKKFHGAAQASPGRGTGPAAATLPASDGDEPMVGASTAFHVLRHKVLRVAPTQATVLLLGESGVGKSLLARDIHRNSTRARASFVEVNCAALPEALVESELFGVERGAYSGAVTSRGGRFEVADGGTIFLDEIGSLSMSAQSKLLRVLQNGEIERLGSSRTLKTDVRVIAATNENLKAAVREGRFREDLFFRLNVFPIVIQPLRERREDIPLLAERLLGRFAGRHGRSIAGITTRALQALLHCAWPGNIRELENVLERGVILAQDGELVDIHHLFSVEDALSSAPLLHLGAGGALTPSTASAQDGPAGALPGDIDELAARLLEQGQGSLPEIEQALVRGAVRQTKGNISRAASLLGLTRAQAEYRAKKLGL